MTMVKVVNLLQLSHRLTPMLSTRIVQTNPLRAVQLRIWAWESRARCRKADQVIEIRNAWLNAAREVWWLFKPCLGINVLTVLTTIVLVIRIPCRWVHRCQRLCLGGRGGSSCSGSKACLVHQLLKAHQKLLFGVHLFSSKLLYFTPKFLKCDTPSWTSLLYTLLLMCRHLPEQDELRCAIQNCETAACLNRNGFQTEFEENGWNPHKTPICADDAGISGNSRKFGRVAGGSEAWWGHSFFCVQVPGLVHGRNDHCHIRRHGCGCNSQRFEPTDVAIWKDPQRLILIKCATLQLQAVECKHT